MLDETMHKSTVSFCVSGGDTNRKGVVMVVSANNPGPTFNNVEAGMLSTMVLAVGITLVSAISPCGSMVLIVGITLAGVVIPCIS